MKPSTINKEQAIKIGKAALYVGVSAVLGYLIATVEGNPQLFGLYTPMINVVLVALKQLFTTSEA